MKAIREQEAVRALGALLREEAAGRSVPDAQNADGAAGRVEPEDWKAAGEARLLQMFRTSKPGTATGTALGAAPGTALATEPGRLGDAARTFRAGPVAGALGRLRQPRAIAGAVAVGLAVAAALAVSLSPPPLSYVVEGDPPRQAGRIVALGDRRQAVKFSDGSELRLEPGSSLRVRETDQDGAMVIVESGEVSSQVQHAAGTRWSIFAGPYEVKVIGTQFDTSWEPESGRMSVVLHTGMVQILGAGIDNVVELKPGQRFDASASSGAWAVQAHRGDQHQDSALEPEGSQELADESVAREVAGEVAGPGVATPKEATLPDDKVVGSRRGSAISSRTPTPAEAPRPERSLAPPTGDAKKTWSNRVAEGDFSAVVTEAETIGLDRCLATCPAERLRAWADASRYTGKLRTAGRVLLRLREVSPQEAARAGYLLGSVSEAQGQTGAALRWYTGYLEEAPSGGFAAEARAGRMRALAAMGQEDAAKSAAREYLRHHPAGAGAKTARQILDRP